MNGVGIPGAAAFLEKLKAGIPDGRIYIASNGATINAKGRIASTGLDRYIDDLFISEDMALEKVAEYSGLKLEKVQELAQQRSA